MTFFSLLKNIFLLLILLQFLPALINGIRKNYGKFITQKTEVAVLPIKGTLCDSAYYIKQLNQFFKDPEIKAILIKMDCPGGAAGTGQTIFNELLALKQEHPKHVEVLVENVCASAGYYIACAADHITAPGAALIGSIGTSIPYIFQLKEFIEQYKIKYTSIKAGEYKTMGDPFLTITPQETALLQAVTQDSYDQFVHDVAQQRSLIITQTNDWANGKIFTAKQAQALGLIDELGSLHTAIASLKDKALIDNEIEWIYAKEPSLWSSWFSDEDDDGILHTTVNQICSTIENRYLIPKIY